VSGGLVRLLSPDAAFCLACGRRTDILARLPLCRTCARALVGARVRTEGLCPRCQAVLYPGRACPVCARDPDRLIERTFSPYRYRATVRALILRLKFGGDVRPAALLYPAMADALDGFVPDAFLPVPLSRARLRERGYNQAELLARLVGDRLNVPVMAGLVRTRNTKRQSELHTIRERQLNISGAFTLLPGFEAEGRSFMLVDDVRTSGATARACAKALRDGGARSVTLLTTAIAPGAGRYFTRPGPGRGRIFHRKGG